MRAIQIDLKRYDIVEFLNDYGLCPRFAEGTMLYYFAPYRNDDEPMLKVSHLKNKWFDLGDNTHGKLLELGVKIFGSTDLYTVAKNIYSISPCCRRRLYGIQRSFSTGKYPYASSDIDDLTLISYMHANGIDEDVLNMDCSQVTFSIGKREIKAVGFPNVNGGFSLKGCNSMTHIGPRGMSLKENNPDDTYIFLFKDFMDLLSFRMVLKYSKLAEVSLNFNYIVLNMKQYLIEALPILMRYKHVHCVMGNTAIGQEISEALLRVRDGVTVANDAYGKYKDISEYLIKEIIPRQV